jgi:hypothetical protein
MDEEILLTVRFSAQVASDYTAMLCSTDNLGAVMYGSSKGNQSCPQVIVRMTGFAHTRIFPFSQFSSTGECALATEVALNNA